jgi:glycosyltransferase involved in cell wall biosynthesis
MKILFLCKRRPQGKDLFVRPYGRFFFLPHLLSQHGHQVNLLLLSYKREQSFKRERNGIVWWSESIYNTGPLKYLMRVENVVQRVKPDWMVGLSDTYYGILAQYFGKKYGIRSAIDAYDNYESYVPWFRLLHKCWRNAIKNATVVTAAGPQLAGYLKNSRPNKNVHILPMAADPNRFTILDKKECRKKLNLPLDKKLIGYCGGINHRRGIDTVFRACDRLYNKNPNIFLILSGRKNKNIRLPENAKWLGYLADELMPILFNSMDVLLVANLLSAFGKFSYPVKLYEAMNCRIPVVAASTEPVRWILNGRNEHLANVGDPEDFAQKISNLLDLDRIDYGRQNSWEESSKIFETILLRDD